MYLREKSSGNKSQKTNPYGNRSSNAPPVGKRKKMLGQKRLTISTPTQKRLTDMWKVVTEIRAPENELEEKEHSDKS